ncbi:MAG TPA: hypothetical protein PK668_02170 [Myxococcota bacterium]|nr:hypothetical protein [Myxococcota bacterium]HSA21490.1 hypothetical protein [Myxococcota bacterium]
MLRSLLSLLPVLLLLAASGCDREVATDPDGCPSSDRPLPGECGLQGTCVQCNDDYDCQAVGPNLVCAGAGTCVPHRHVCEMDYECLGLQDGLKCVDFHCVTPCTFAGECRYGSECGPEGYCQTRYCQAGACPEGWVPVEGSLACTRDGCSELGLLRGACGLAEQCVECFADAHCPEGICSDAGACVPVECDRFADCQAGVCLGGRCVQECAGSADCAEDERCTMVDLLLKGCEAVRCVGGAGCAEWGYRPREGTLRCDYRPCTDPAEQPGVCGLTEHCVRCLDDTSCEAGRRCNRWGHCELFPACPFEVGYTSCAKTEVCLDGTCTAPCAADVDCRPEPQADGTVRGTGVCVLPEGGCFYERCDRSGRCPVGWVPPQGYTGTLDCKRKP